ncbi:MAG: DUF4340 domain-containing protein [Verrucomicrobia bacterium]|nr:DUF4340 domain-containing protein [Verrucomicrobiota bacterium]MDA1065183.1 DUF4340 domain-containing protein [Verrucomicrobiota bacterium]
MKLRTLIIVTVALAVVTVAGYYIRNASLTTPQDDPLVGTSLVDSTILPDVNRIEVSKNGTTSILEIDENKQWVVRSLFDLPVDFNKLNRLVQDIVNAKVQRKITSRQDRMDRLELNQGTVKLMSGSDKPLFEITYGKSLSGGGKAFIFGREKTAYQAFTSPSVDADSNNWAVKTLYQLNADNVAGIQFSLANETWGVRRDDKDKEFVSTLPIDTRTPKESAIKSLISRFSNLRFDAVAERATEEASQIWKDAQSKVRSIKFTLFSGETISIKMSQWEPPTPEGEDAPTSTGPSTTYLHISNSQVDHSINKLMNRLSFKTSSYTFTGIPVDITEVADLPEPEVKSEAVEAPAPEEVSAEATAPGQPEIKQHIDGNSVIFEVTPAKKEEDKTVEERTTPQN